MGDVIPKYPRLQPARDATLVTKVLRGVLQVISAWQRRKARHREEQVDDITGDALARVQASDRARAPLGLGVAYRTSRSRARVVHPSPDLRLN